jgi:hypothetical protein
VKIDLVPGPSTSTAAPQKTAAPAPTGTTSDDRSTSFRPVEGGTEMQSGEKLLVEAYAAIWVILFALVLLSWRRQRGIDDRMATLAAAIEKARGAADGSAEDAGGGR